MPASLTLFVVVCLMSLSPSSGASLLDADFTPGTGAQFRTSPNYVIADSIGQFVVGTSRQCEEGSDPIYCPYSCAILEHGFWNSDVYVPTITEVKNTVNDQWVEAFAKVVSAGSDQFSREFFITEGDRLNGIRVNLGNQALSIGEGDMVDVAGVISGGSTDRYINYPIVVPRFQSVAQIDPFFARNQSLGGKGTDVGIPGGFGALNTNLLMRTSGLVTYVDTATPKKFFYIDDGSGLSDGLTIGGQMMKGIRISITNLATGNIIVPPSVGEYVSVTGICAPRTVSGKILAQIRPRRQNDISVLRH